MISFNAIQSPFSAPASATDEARIAAILAILETENARLPQATPPVIAKAPSPQFNGNRVYRSWRDAADALLAKFDKKTNNRRLFLEALP